MMGDTAIHETGERARLHATKRPDACVGKASAGSRERARVRKVDMYVTCGHVMYNVQAARTF